MPTGGSTFPGPREGEVTRRRMLLAAWVLVLLTGCEPRDPAPAGRLLPDPPEGWTFAQGPTDYTPETLYEYLNGGAPLYLEYGFVHLTQARYQLGDDPLATVVVDVFDMGSDLGAFGLFRSILPPDASVEEWCTEGYGSGTVAAAWKGRHYIHVEADDDREALVALAHELTSRLCRELPGDRSLPALLDPLPRERLVPRSERYVAADLFGHAFLRGGVLARYLVDGDEAEVFFSDLGGEEAAQDALGRLRGHLEQWGEVGDTITDLGSGGYRFVDPGLGAGLVVRRGTFLVGVHGAGDAEGLVREVVRALPQP
jgi:hypothetical protein